jgi:predicted RNA-binding protein YlqC (UPF0109 family)
VSDSSGPFAVPNFPQAAEADDEEFDEIEGDEFVGEDSDDDSDDSDEVVEPDAAVSPAAADETPSGPVDGGAAQAVLEHIARSIVDEPDAVRVEVSSQRGGVRLDLHVASSDMGRIIGRRGRVAQALRSLVRAAGAKDGTDASVDIVD